MFLISAHFHTEIYFAIIPIHQFPATNLVVPGEGQSVANETEETPRPSVSRMEKLKCEAFFVCCVFSLLEHFLYFFHTLNA